jgi:hypothetical protein
LDNLNYSLLIISLVLSLERTLSAASCSVLPCSLGRQVEYTQVQIQVRVYSDIQIEVDMERSEDIQYSTVGSEK